MARWNPQPAAERRPASPTAKTWKNDDLGVGRAQEQATAGLALMTEKAGRTAVVPRQVLALQALSGNRAVAALVKKSRQPAVGRPSPSTSPSGRRGAGRPGNHQDGGDAVQGLWDPPQALPPVQRHSLAGIPPAPESEWDKASVQGLWNPQPTAQRDLTLGGHRRPRPPKHAPPPIPGFGTLALSKTDLPADGATTSQATLSAGGNRTDLVWAVADAGTGTTVDGAGLVTAGKTLGGSEQKAVTVSVREKSGLGRNTSILLNVIDPVVLQARTDCRTFLAGGPYTWPNYKTANGFGRFDATYDPQGKLLRIDMRLKFNFVDDPIPAVGTAKQKKKVEDRQDAYVATILQQAKAGWDRKFQFRNVRPPASVWDHLGPIAVQTNFVRTTAADQHFLFNAKTKTQGTANVTATGKTNFFKGSEKVKQAFNPEAQVGETSRVKQAAPDLFVTPKGGALTGASQASAAFLGLYLKRLNVPPFKLKVRGFGGRKVGLANAGVAKTAIEGGGLAAPHSIVAGWRFGGDPTKVTIKPVVSGSWRNLQDITAHEFGHMLGLDDEYATAATPAGAGIETYGRVKAMFGTQYADLSAKAGVDSASLMDGGTDVRVQHSVTLWDALNDLTSKKAAVPTPKFGEADWKVIG